MSVLGLDTSCYTTSIAVVDGPEVLEDCRTILRVPQGERGLQQSKALFQHVQNLPELMERMDASHRGWQAIAVSTRPRPVDGSYMPVFTAGHGLARSLAAALGLPLFETTHQEGHIAAAAFTTNDLPGGEPFLAFHLSGGTTELIRAVPGERGYSLHLVGGTLDLHAGQLVDRVGVAMGLGFPAGPALEELALASSGRISGAIKAKVIGAQCNLSGAEAAAQRLLAGGADRADVAHELLVCLAETFAAMATHAARHGGLTSVCFIGGVASNRLLRARMTERLAAAGLRACFAPPRLSSDNAVGVAFLGQQFLR